MKIGKYLTTDEICYSRTAIRNNIDNNFVSTMHISNARLLCHNVYDPLCDHFKFKIPFTSFYRSPNLNRVIKGSKGSQHMSGQAVDLDPNCQNGLSNDQLFHYIRTKIKFDQLIWEFGDDKQPAWVHVSYADNPRKQVLKAIKDGKVTKYIPL